LAEIQSRQIPSIYQAIKLGKLQLLDLKRSNQTLDARTFDILLAHSRRLAGTGPEFVERYRFVSRVYLTCGPPVGEVDLKLLKRGRNLFPRDRELKEACERLKVSDTSQQ